MTAQGANAEKTSWKTARLLEQVRWVKRLHDHSLHTKLAYADGLIRRYIRFQRIHQREKPGAKRSAAYTPTETVD